MPHIQLLSLLGDQLSSVQSILAFDGWVSYPQFNNDKGYGRIALLACILGIVLGVHVIVGIQLVLLHMGMLPKHLIFGSNNEGWASSSSNENELQIMILLQWVLYIIVLCIFHLAEFFTTAVYNPTATSADSFMVCIYFQQMNMIIHFVYSFFSAIMNMRHILTLVYHLYYSHTR
jgi:hypothetical protein